MANAFNLTAQLNLKGPTNVGVIVSDIKKQLGTISANVNITISANAAKNVTQLNSALLNLNKTFQATQVSATSAANAIAQFNAAVNNINIKAYQTGVNSATTASQQLTSSQANVSKALQSSSSEMEEFGKQAGLAVRRFSAFSAVTSVIFGLTNAFSKGVSSFVDFDKELVKLQQVTGESASGLGTLQNTITSLSTKLGVGSNELLNISSTLAQAGLSARDTEKALKALALSSLAPSFDSMNETVEGSIALMRQFGIGAGDLTKALGSVNAVAAKFAVEASDIISAIQRTGGVFASASKGVSEGTDALNEFIAVFTSVRATTRESAETIATGLRTIFTRIQRESTIDALKEYGVTLTDLDGKFVGAYRAVELLSKGLNNIDPRDLKFSRIVEELGGFRQIGKVIPLIQEFGTAQQALSVAQSGQNSLTADSITAQLSLANQISKVREEFMALFREIGASDTFQTMVRGSLQLVSSLIKIGDAVKGILPVLAVVGISKGLGALTKFGSGFIQGVQKGPDNKAGGFSEGGVVRRFATGGFVPGVGNQDSVPAMLTPGEFVMTKSAVQKYGAGNLVRMNKYAKGGPITIEELKTINPSAVQPDYRNVEDAKNKTGEKDQTWSIYRDKGKTGKVRTTAVKYMQPKDEVYGDVDYMPVPDPNRSEVEKYFGNIRLKKGIKSVNPKDKRISTAYEDYVQDKIKTIGARYSGNYDPLDFETGDVKFYSSEENIQKYVSINKVLSKRLRHENKENRIKWQPNSPEKKELESTAIYHPTDLTENNSLKQRISDWVLLSQNQKTTQAVKMGDAFNSGGLVQKFDIGGEAKAIRRIGIIDSDVLRQAIHAEKVAEGMKSIGSESIKDYTIQLAKLGVQKRKSGDLKKFRVIAGAAGSGKSSLATGVSANDNASLRQTVRSQIISPQDLDNVDEVLTITANVSDAKLEAYLRDADRTYTLSSDTKAEQNLVTNNKDSRDVTGKLLYDREPGRTKGVSPDFGIEQATLMDELGSKNVVLGRKEDAQGNLTNRFRRKRGDELPEIVQAEGFYTGGFSPPTRGHRGAFDTLLENVITKNPNATIKDILVSVAPNVAMVEGKEGLAHAARYGIFDADFRSLLAGINFQGAMISSDTQPTGGILPKVMEVPGENNRRKFARLKGAMAITSGKEKGALGKYDRAGIAVTDIPRIEDISATTVRELLFSQNYTQLDKIVNPEVGAILKGNQPQLKNRSVMVPVLLEEINKISEINKILANQKVDNILANAPGGPYTNVTKQLKAEHPEIAAQVKSIRDERDAFKKSASGAKSHSIIRQLASTYPEIYGIDPSRRAATTASTISAEDARSHLGDRVKSLLPEGTEIPETSLLESIKQNVIKQLAAPKGSGTLPTDSKTITRTFLNMPVPSDPTFGMFSGKSIDSGMVNKVWRQTYPGLSEDKTASYIAVKEWLESQYNARTGAKTEELSQAIEESKMVGLVGMLPIGHERLSGPFTWMLGKNAAGDDVSVTASIIERGLGKKYEEEIRAAQKHAEQGSESLAAGLSSKMKKRPESLRSLDKNQLETLGQGNIEGAYIEQALARLWANLDNVSTRTRPIDYPDGLGESAELFPGISPTMPTEVKRTINSDSRGDAIKEFQKYFRLINGIPEPKEPKESKEAKTQKEVVKALAQGGEVQNFMAGGVATKTRKPKEPFGTGETEFPTRISKKYAEEQHSASESLRAKLAWDKNPKDERIMIDDEKVKESFQQPFDRERFASSFKEKISRDSLFERMSDFAKFVGLPQEDLSTALPLQLDFGGSKRGGGLGMFAAAQFEKGATGIRPYEGYDISKSGYGEKQKQEAYGLEKLITAKEKEIAKIVKTPTRTYDDGSFSFDSEAYSKANNELGELKNRSFKLKDLKRDAEKAALAEQSATSSATGRGTISFASSMGYSSDTKNSTLYHEMIHQLFQGLRTRSAGSFDKYRDRVSSLFSGDNDDLADAFDSLTAGGGYSSADVVYGRSYKSNNLSQILSSYYRQNGDSSSGATPIPQDITKNLASLSNQSTAAKRAREYRPINPQVNEALLQGGDKFGMTQEKISRMEDNGKEEFLTTLMENAPKLDGRLQPILDSTLTELLSGAGIQRQKYAAGGKASRGVDLDKGFMANPVPSPFNKTVSKKLGPEVYDLEKSSGLSRGQFQQAYEYAKMMDFTREEFEKDLGRRRILEEQKAQIKTSPSDMAKQLMPEVKTSTPKQIALGKTLQDTSNNIGYRPSALERIAQARSDINNATRGFAAGGEVEGSSDLSNWENVQQDPSFQQAIADFERLYGRNNVMNKLQFDAYDKDNSKTPKIGMDQGLSGVSYKVTPGLIEQKGPEYQDIIANRVAGYRKANKVQQAAIEKNKIKSPAQQAAEDAPFIRDARIQKALETQGKSMREYESRPRETDYAQGGFKRRKFAVGGVAEPEKKKEKEYGYTGLYSDTSAITAMYFGNKNRTGSASAYKFRDNLYYMGMSSATSGYGPRLYDIVMEAATEQGSMLTSDRNVVSGAAKRVWEYYFNNRPDVNKTQLDPKDWTRNQAMIDPALQGDKSTWPPVTDPAWILQSGYSKSPSLIKDPTVKRLSKEQKSNMDRMAVGNFMSAKIGNRDKFAGGGAVSLYHGSNTGTNDNVLKSFKEKGALSDVAQGYGQGAGFYVYSGREKAKEQAMMRVKGGLGSFAVVSGDTAGKPMVLTFKEMLDPDTWDLDYELNKGPVVKWLAENYDKIKDKVAPGEKLTGIKDVVSPDSSKGIMSHGIRVQSDTGSRKSIYSGTDSDLREGQLVGQIMARLQAQDPKMVGDFENTFFKSPTLASGEWDNLALKYVGSSPLKPINIETFADGGSVPAMVSNGEAYVPPAMARSIGYSKLASMNQADRNGMRSFASGGISVFKGPGTGTSDSIPVSLPVGSFIIREKATKALGFSSGGSVGIQKFVTGGTVTEDMIRQKEEREAKIAELGKVGKGGLRDEASKATGSARILLESKIKDIETELVSLDASIGAASGEFDTLSNTVEIASRAEEKRQKTLDTAQANLVQEMERAGTVFGGRKFEDLNDSEKEQAVTDARAGNIKDSTGKDIFETQNTNINTAQVRLDKASSIKETAKIERSTKFGDSKTAQDVQNRALTSTELKDKRTQDKAFFEYKGKKEGTTADAYKYKVAQQLGQASFQATEQYAGRKQEMSYELTGKQESLSNLGATIRSAQEKSSMEVGTGPGKISQADKDAASTQLADAQSRLAIESENIAKSMRDLNPTLDMGEVQTASKEIADLLSNGKLAEAQEKMTEALGEVPGPVEAMSIAMEKVAKDLGIDVSTLQREYGDGAGKKTLERQQFIASKEGQRFGVGAEIAPDLAKWFSKTKTGEAGANVSDFLTGKGGKYSQMLGKVGGITTVAAGISAAPGLVQKALGDPNSGQGAALSSGAQSAASVAGAGIQLASSSGPLAPFVLAGTAVAALASAFKDGRNAFIEFEKNLRSKNIQEALESTSKSFEDLGRDNKDANAKRKITEKLNQAGNEAEQSTKIDSTIPKAFWVNLFDAMGGGKEATDRSKILEKQGTGAYLSSLKLTNIGGLFGGPSAEENRRGLTNQLIPEQAQNNAKQYTEISAQTKKLLEVKVQSGESLSSIQSSPEYEQFAKNIALADVAVQSEILAIENSTRADKEAAKAAVIKARADEESAKTVKASERDKASKDLEKASRSFSMSFQRMFDNMNQTIDRVNFNLSKFNNSLDLSVSAMSGQAKSGKTNFDAVNVLKNPRAYNTDQVTKANNQAASLFGADQGIVGGLSTLGDKLESSLLKSINTTIRDNPGASDSKISIDIEKVIDEQVGKLGLPKDLASQIGKEINTAVGDLRKEGTKKIDLETLTERIGGLSNVINSAKSAQTASIAALENWQNTLNAYSDAMNSSMEKDLDAAENRSKANDIMIDGALNLGRALGKEFSADTGTKIRDQKVASMTGGVVNPNAIGNQLASLEDKRRQQQAETDYSKQQSVGKPGASQNVIENEKALKRTNMQLRQTYAALKLLAESGDAASNALNAIQEAQRKQQGKVGLVEKLVTSNPAELQSFNRALGRLQKISGGQDVRQTADERKETLSVLNDITPLLGNSQQANNIKATTLESMLRDSGVGVNSQFQGIIDAMRNPEQDSETQQAIQTYQEAISVQQQANEALAEINDRLADDIARKSAEAMQSALSDLRVKFDDTQIKDLVQSVRDLATTTAGGKATGGLIYAAGGSLIDFQPRGTDTVPAMLTPGEFVVNRAATSRNLSTLQSMNNGSVNYYSDGGYVSNVLQDSTKKSGHLVTKGSYPEISNLKTSSATLYTFDRGQVLPTKSSVQNFNLDRSKTSSIDTSSVVFGENYPTEMQFYPNAAGQFYNRSWVYNGSEIKNGESAHAAPVGDYINFGDAAKIGEPYQIKDSELETYKNDLNNIQVPRDIKKGTDHINIDGKKIFKFTTEGIRQAAAQRVAPAITYSKQDSFSPLVNHSLYLRNLASSLNGNLGLFNTKAEETSSKGLLDFVIKDMVSQQVEIQGAEASFKGFTGELGAYKAPKAYGVTPAGMFDDSQIQAFINVSDTIKKAKELIATDDAKYSRVEDDALDKTFADLASIYQGTVKSISFGKEDKKFKISDFTSSEKLEVFSTSPDNWKNNYLKEIEEQKKHNKRFEDLEYYKPGGEEVKIQPSDRSGPEKSFPWIGVKDGFSFSDTAQKQMQMEVDDNINRTSSVGTMLSSSTKMLKLPKSGVELPYNSTYSELTTKAAISGGVLAGQKLYLVDSPKDPLNVFQKLQETIKSRLYVDDAGYKANDPINDIITQLDDDDNVNDYFDALKTKKKDDPEVKKLERTLFGKKVDIAGKFLRPSAPGSSSEFSESYTGSTALNVGEYLTAAGDKYQTTLGDQKKSATKKQFKAEENKESFFNNDELPGATLAFVLAAQDFFGNGAPFEIPNLLGKGWFSPRLGPQYKSIYDVDTATIKNTMARIATGFNAKSGQLSKYIKRSPNQMVHGHLEQTISHLNSAWKIFDSIGRGSTKEIGSYFSPKDFDIKTPKGDPNLTAKAKDIIESMGLRSKIETAGTKATLTDDDKAQREIDLEGVEVSTGVGAETKEINPSNFPKNYLELYNLAVNPYTKFPNRAGREKLLNEFITAAPTARDGNNALLFNPPMLATVVSTLTNLKSWYTGEPPLWQGTDYLYDKSAKDPKTNEPIPYSTRIKDLTANFSQGLYDTSRDGYTKIGAKAKFGDLPDIKYYEKIQEPQYKQVGGMIYASTGKLINFEPRGTDTVPAMLTPGEFVVNRAATQQHLPLLQAINSGSAKALSKGGVVYLAGGGHAKEDNKDDGHHDDHGHDDHHGGAPHKSSLYAQTTGNIAIPVIAAASASNTAFNVSRKGISVTVDKTVKSGLNRQTLQKGVKGGAGRLVGNAVDNLASLGGYDTHHLGTLAGEVVDSGRDVVSHVGHTASHLKHAGTALNTAKGAQTLAGASAAGVAAAYGAYTLGSIASETGSVLSGETTFADYEKKNNKQLNQSYSKNVGENLYNPGSAIYQTAAIAGDSLSLFDTSGRLAQDKKTTENIKRLEDAATAKRNGDKFIKTLGLSSGGVVYLAGGGMANPQYSAMRKAQRENTKRLVEAKREQIKQHSKDVKAQQLTVKNQIRASLGKTPLAAQSEATTDNGIDYDPNQNGDISPQEREAGDIKRGILALSEEDRKLLRIEDPDKREAALQSKMDKINPALFAARKKAIKSREDRRTQLLEAQIKERGVDTLSDQESIFLATRKKKLKAEDTTNKTQAFAAKVGQSLKSAPSAVSAAKVYLAGAMATNPATAPSAKPTATTTPTPPTARPVPTTTPPSPVGTTPPTPAATTPTIPTPPPQKAMGQLSLEEWRERRNHFTTQQKEEDDARRERSRKASADRKAAQQADLEQKTKERLAPEKAREEERRIRDAKVKENTKDTRTWSEKYLGLNLQAGYKTAGETTDRLVASAEIGVNSALDAMGRPVNDRMRPSESRMAENRRIAKDKDTRPFSEKYLGLNFEAGIQTAKEQVAALGSAGSAANQAIEQSLGIKPTDRLGRPLSKKVLAARKKDAEIFNKGVENAPGLKTVAKVGMGALEVAGAAGESGVGVIRAGVGTTVAIGAGLTAGVAESVGANTVARYADAFSEQGVLEAERGVRNVQRSGAIIGQNVIDSSLGTNIYGKAREEATGRIGEIAQNRSDAAADVAGNTGRYLQTGADLTTELAGSAATDIGVGKLATAAQSRIAAAVAKIDVGRLATGAQSLVGTTATKALETGTKALETGTKVVTEGAGKVRKYVGDAAAASGKRAADRVRKISGPSQRKVDKLIKQGYSPGDAAELITDHRSYALDEIQYRNLRRKVGGKPFGRKNATPEHAAQIAEAKIEQAAQIAEAERLSQMPMAQRKGLETQKQLAESGTTELVRAQRRAAERGVNPDTVLSSWNSNKTNPLSPGQFKGQGSLSRLDDFDPVIQQAAKDSSQRASMQRTMGIDPATGKYVGHSKPQKTMSQSAKEKVTSLYQSTKEKVASLTGRTKKNTVTSKPMVSSDDLAINSVESGDTLATAAASKIARTTDEILDAVEYSDDAKKYMSGLTKEQMVSFRDVAKNGSSPEKQAKLLKDLMESASKDNLVFAEGDDFYKVFKDQIERGELTVDEANQKMLTRGNYTSNSKGKTIRINPEQALESTRTHEIAHFADDMAGTYAPMRGNYSSLQKMVGSDLDGFLDSSDYASVVDGLGSAYDGKMIRSRPQELLTVLTQGKADEATKHLFTDGSKNQEMLTRLWQARGYQKGGIVYASNGALIEAQQGTDRVPAMLTPGEFVINRQSAQRHMPVLNAINSGHYSHGGVVQYLSGGGAVQPAYLANGSMVNNIANSSSQSGVLNSASAAKPVVMEKPAWVDDFISKFNQGASTLIQSATEISSGAGSFASGAEKISGLSLPSSIALNGNFGFTQEAVSNIIGRSVGESVAISNANSANQVSSSAANTMSNIAKSTDYGILPS